MGSKYKMTWVIDPEVKKASLGSVNQLPTLEVRQTAELGFLCPKWTERPIPSNLSMVILWANYGHIQVCPAPHISWCQAPRIKCTVTLVAACHGAQTPTYCSHGNKRRDCCGAMRRE